MVAGASNRTRPGRLSMVAAVTCKPATRRSLKKHIASRNLRCMSSCGQCARIRAYLLHLLAERAMTSEGLQISCVQCRGVRGGGSSRAGTSGNGARRSAQRDRIFHVAELMAVRTWRRQASSRRNLPHHRFGLATTRPFSLRLLLNRICSCRSQCMF